MLNTPFNLDEAKHCIAGRTYYVNQYIKIYSPEVYEVIDFGEDNSYDELKYSIAGSNFWINKNLTVYIPTVQEVADFGEDIYFHVLNAIIRKPYDIAVELDDNGIDYQSITDWDLFVDTASQIPIEYSCILFGKFDFSKLKAYVNDEGTKILVNQENPDIVIDEAIYRIIVTYLRYIHFISEKVEYDVGNSIAKKFLLERMRRKQKKALKDYLSGKKKRHSQLADMIKFCVNNAGMETSAEVLCTVYITELWTHLRCTTNQY